MSAIEGIKKESKNEESSNNFEKKVGLFEANVIAINPTAEEYLTILERELNPDSKAIEYLGTSKDGNTYLRVDVWLEEIKNKFKFKVSFFLEDKEKQNRDGNKNQYINSVGITSWASNENDLYDWFTKDRDYRIAYVGEDELYNFMRVWLSKLDYRSSISKLQLDWKKLMRGNIKDLKDEINNQWCDTVLALATVVVKERDGEIKEYQGVYNKGFLPGYNMKQFRLLNYTDSSIFKPLLKRKPRELKIYERFVVDIIGDYGCKDYYILKELENYKTGDNLVASDNFISEDGTDY